MYDHALWRTKSLLKEHDIAFVPGLNEDLAATAAGGVLRPASAQGCR
jgi:indolepyruvate ferredoxin oxidoreductase